MLTTIRWIVVGTFVLLTAVATFAQSSFPVDSIRGPVCVMYDTVLQRNVTLSPITSRYNVVVTDGIAHLRLTQTFVNPFAGVRDIVYVFPLPHDGAVHGMSMFYRDSLYTARIYERQQAQQMYDSVVAAGGSAALLVQTRPNIFQQRIANIARGDTAQVSVEVSAPLKYNAGVFELSIPTMIGERFQSMDADPVPGTGFWNPPEDRDGQSLEVNVLLQTGYDITGIESPTHTLSVMPINTGRPVLEQRSLLTPDTELPMPCNRVAVLASASTYPNRDFVLRFSRANAVNDFTLASYYDPQLSLGHFALNLFPDPSLFNGARPNVEIVLLVDVSGSQSGWPLDREKQIASSILDRLAPTDRLTVLSFSDQVYWCYGSTSPVAASAQNIATARTWIEGLQTLGGTQLLAGVQAALSAPISTEHLRYYVFLTDGFITNESAILDEIKNHPTHPTVFTFGAGNNLNRYFLEQCAAIGNGYATEVTEYEPVVPKVDAAWQKIEAPQLRNVSVDFGNASVSDVIMPLGNNLYVGSPLPVYGAYRNGGLQTVTVTAYREGERVQFSKQITLAHGHNLNRMVPQMWARQRIEQLSAQQGATDTLKMPIIAVSIDYQVLCKYTAFLAIRPEPLARETPDGWTTIPGAISTETRGRPSHTDGTIRTALQIAVSAGRLNILSPAGESLLSFEVVDLSGRVVYKVSLDRAQGVGLVTWDCRTADGRLLSAGRYLVRVRTTSGVVTRMVSIR